MHTQCERNIRQSTQKIASHANCNVTDLPKVIPEQEPRTCLAQYATSSKRWRILGDLQWSDTSRDASHGVFFRADSNPHQHESCTNVHELPATTIWACKRLQRQRENFGKEDQMGWWIMVPCPGTTMREWQHPRVAGYSNLSLATPPCRKRKLR